MLTEFLGVEPSPRFDRALRRARASSIGIARGRGGTDSQPADVGRLLRELGYSG
jgi:hypothetical protein